MSLGPSSLSSLLVQRLDTVLGVSQSSAKNTGSHPDALRQSTPIPRFPLNEQRTTRENVNQANTAKSTTAQTETDKRLGNPVTDKRYTPSAPTTLGHTARTLLTLLSSYNNQPLQGRQPMLATQVLSQLNADRTPQATPSSPTTAAPSSSAAATTAPAATTTATMTNATPVNAATLKHVVQALTQQLAQSISQSGLFYESHLAQLTKGQQTPSQLQKQPQAQAHVQTENHSTQAKEKTSAPLNPERSPSLLLQQDGINPSTQQLVRQQLETLATQQLVWRGEAWPGVPMEWEIQRRQEDNESSAAGDAEDQAPWQTRLAVDLPHLGSVEAKIYLDNNQLRLQLTSPQSQNQLNSQVQQLAERLQSHGLHINQLLIRQYDHDLN